MWRNTTSCFCDFITLLTSPSPLESRYLPAALFNDPAQGGRPDSSRSYTLPFPASPLFSGFLLQRDRTKPESLQSHQSLTNGDFTQQEHSTIQPGAERKGLPVASTQKDVKRRKCGLGHQVPPLTNSRKGEKIWNSVNTLFIVNVSNELEQEHSFVV